MGGGGVGGGGGGGGVILLLIHWLVLYFSSVNCEIRSRLVFIRNINVFQNANPRL